MTYAYYIRKNNLKDSKDTYAEYVRNYCELAKAMPKEMQAQYIEVNFKYRFINNAWL